MRLTPAQRAAILRRYAGGEKIIAIAAAIGVSERWINELVRRHGLVRRRGRRKG